MGRPSPSKLVAVRAGGRYGFVSRGAGQLVAKGFPGLTTEKYFFGTRWCQNLSRILIHV